MSSREGDEDAGAAEVDEGDEGCCGVKPEAPVADQSDAAIEAFEPPVGSIRRSRVMKRICVISCG
jgi:hypothetical protein